MLSGKYHIGSLAAVFLALGIGILIGGTLGQSWMDQTETRLIRKVLDKYELAMQDNQNLTKQLTSLQLVNRAVAPILQQKHIWWIKHERQERNDQQHPTHMLAVAASSLGAVWEEKQAEEVFQTFWGKNDETTSSATVPVPDILVFTDPQTTEAWHLQQNQRRSLQSPPVIIDATNQLRAWSDPQEIANFILYLKQIVEEYDPYAHQASVDIYHYSGLE